MLPNKDEGSFFLLYEMQMMRTWPYTFFKCEAAAFCSESEARPWRILEFVNIKLSALVFKKIIKGRKSWQVARLLTLQ